MFALRTIRGLGAEPSVVLTREDVDLHKSLCVCADHSQVQIWFGQGLCAFGRLCFKGLSSYSTNFQVADRLAMIDGSTDCVKVRWAELGLLRLPSGGSSGWGR
jgi:hypothetical protein